MRVLDGDLTCLEDTVLKLSVGRLGWLQHFGLTSKAVSMDVHADGERDGALIWNSLVVTPFPFVVRSHSKIRLEGLREWSET